MTKLIAWIDEDRDKLGPIVWPLQEQGYTVKNYRDVKDALTAFDEILQADLILLDLILPSGEFGKSAGRYAGINILRKIRDKTDTPVIILSVVTKEDILEQARQLGVSDIIRKPILPYTLKDKVEAILPASS